MVQRNIITNQSTVTEFLLMGFSNDPGMQIFHFGVFLSIYLIALLGNFLIVISVALNEHLHTPMYFFLVNLSFLDTCYISTTVPKSMTTLMFNNRLISFSGCVAQVLIVVSLATLELFLLTVMAYDRYVAICHPLHYRLIMNWDSCIKLVAACWITSVINGVIETIVTFRLRFCWTNVIGQFFCDIPQLQKISCTDIHTSQVVILVIGLTAGTLCCVFIFVSYGYIFSAVLRMPSVQGRHKAFSTCLPHLTVFSLFICTALFSYIRPKALSSPAIDLLSAVLYNVLPPVLNPIIYSLRNRDIQKAVLKIPKQIRNLKA